MPSGMTKKMAQVAIFALSCVGTAVASPGGKAPRSSAPNHRTSMESRPGAGIQGYQRGPGRAGATRMKRKLQATSGKRVIARTSFAPHGQEGASPRDATADFIRADGTFDPAKLDALDEMFQSYTQPMKRLTDLDTEALVFGLKFSLISAAPGTIFRVAMLRTKLATFRALVTATAPAREEIKAHFSQASAARSPIDTDLIVPVAHVATVIANVGTNPFRRAQLIGRLNDLGPAKLSQSLALYASMTAGHASAIAKIRARHAATVGPAEALYAEINDELAALTAITPPR